MKMKLVYISGGEHFSPEEIKSALDDIRLELKLPKDIVLFGLPVDSLSEAKVVNETEPLKEHKVLRFPGSKPILSVIENPVKKPTISDEHLVVDEEILSDVIDEVSITEFNLPDEDGISITSLMDSVKSMKEDESHIKSSSLATEFSEFLVEEEQKKPIEPKKQKSFARKSKGAFVNLLGDLFNYAGIANDNVEEFKMPDFIKRH